MPQEKYAGFFMEFLKNPGSVGAVAPSSRRLASQTVNAIDWESVETLCEFGPGTGAITEIILNRKPPHVNFFAIERCGRFVTVLQERFPGLKIIEDSVANVRAVAESQGYSKVDAVISGLPWSSFSDECQTEYLEALVNTLGPRGQFATYAYLTGLPLPSAQRFRKKLHKYFAQVRCSKTIWGNMPPAFVYHCRM
jgi:phosphatidylethanolamine/phosphatidyl-N-methylethanolamine N-methyltransferase